MKNVELVVKGMVCAGCEKRVINALSLIEGIADIKASHVDNVVSFKINGNVSLDEIQESIIELGFEVE